MGGFPPISSSTPIVLDNPHLIIYSHRARYDYHKINMNNRYEVLL